MPRKLVPWLGAIAGIVVAVMAGAYFASESGEVVVLRTRDAAGAVRETRLWVVDHDGSPWLRAGNSQGGWFTRLSAQPEVEVVRGGETRTFHAQPTPAARDTINELMQRKYGWADSYVSVLFPRSKKVPVRLLPAGGDP
jgi:hypothetical protein